MSVFIPTQIEKCKGAMLAAAIGDALGWPNELRSKNRIKKPKVNDHFVEWTRSSSNPRWHDERILAGEYSDDTQMILSVARSIIAGGWEDFFAKKELPFWLNYERGGGSALLKAAKAYKEGISPWQSKYCKDYFNAGGNGAAMRILPHVISFAKCPDTTRLMANVIKDTLITHGHPRAFLGATCYAYALDYLLRKESVLEYGELVSVLIDRQGDWGTFPDTDVLGKWFSIEQQQFAYDFVEEWKNTQARLVGKLEFIGDSLKKGLIMDDKTVLTELECFGKANGAGDVAALAAIYLASKYANNPSLGIKISAFSFGADTDTIASMTGGLLGMLSGTNWIPTEWRIVQDYDCIIQMTELLLADNKKEATKIEVEEVKGQSNQWTITPIGKMKLVESKSVPNGQHGSVVIKKWETILGQTLYTKDFKPKEVKSQTTEFDGQIDIHQLMLLCNDTDSQVQTKDGGISKTSSHARGNKRRDITVGREAGQFILDLMSINDLLCNPNFNTNITIGKVLKIIRSLLCGEEAIKDIAKKYDIEQYMIEQIKKYIF